MRIIMPPPPWESVRIVGTVICYRNESHPAAASTEITRNDVRGENSLLRPSYDLPSSALSHDLVPLSPKARSCFFLLRICLQPRPCSAGLRCMGPGWTAGAWFRVHVDNTHVQFLPSTLTCRSQTYTCTHTRTHMPCSLMRINTSLFFYVLGKLSSYIVNTFSMTSRWMRFLFSFLSISSHFF